MGLPMWTSRGYGDENKSPQSPSRIPDATKLSRSPIRRRAEYTSSNSRIRAIRRTRRVSSAVLRNIAVVADSHHQHGSSLETPLPVSSAPNAPNDHVTMAPYLATLMRASIVLQVAIDRGAAIRSAIRELSPFVAGMPLLENDLDEALIECESIYDLHARVYRAMRLLDQNLICSPRTTHVRENMRSNLERTTYQLTRSTDRPTQMMHALLRRMSNSGLCVEARRLILRYRVSLPIIRFSSSEFTNIAERDLQEFPPLERVNARDIPVAYARPVSSEPSSGNSTPSMPAEAFVNPTGGLGDRSRSISADNDAGAWDTMLSTIEPDATLPSAESSFTSAVASQSFSADADQGSNDNMEESSPIESISEPTLTQVIPPLEAPLPPGSFRGMARYIRHRRNQRPHSPLSESGERPSEIIETGPPPPLSPPSTGSPSSDVAHSQNPFRLTYDPLSHPELSHMRTVLVGLSQSDDIPEDWWASAGLTPYMLEAVRDQAQNNEESGTRESRQEQS